MDRTTSVTTGLASTGKVYWISTLKTELNESSLASNLVIGVLLIWLEKLVELEFPCPCEPQWNALFASAYFILPALAASLMKLYTRGYNCKNYQDVEKFALNVLVPAIMWIVLLFWDGQYYACAKTDWSGRFVIVDKAAPYKWCEPTNNTSSQELMVQTQRWFFVSQFWGFVILALSGILFGACKGLHMIHKFCKTKRQNEEEEMALMYGPVLT